jgi:hypothetical protein
MPEIGRGKANQTEAVEIKSPPEEPKAGSRTGGPQIVFRDGVAYLDEYDIPIWRLEMGRRARSDYAALIASSPGLTAEGLDLAFAYGQQHKAEFDPLIQMHSGADVPPEDEGDDEDDATFDAELDALLTENAQVFRRLAE